jgi:hypothetical protein
MYDDANLGVTKIDTYAKAKPPAYGLDISERLFWEAYVINQDCSRPDGTEWDIGRGSEVSLKYPPRHYSDKKSSEPFCFVSTHQRLILWT